MQELVAHVLELGPYKYHLPPVIPSVSPFQHYHFYKRHWLVAHKNVAECISYCIFCVGFDHIKYFTLLCVLKYLSRCNLDDLLTFLLKLSLFQVFGSFQLNWNTAQE